MISQIPIAHILRRGILEGGIVLGGLHSGGGIVSDFGQEFLMLGAKYVNSRLFQHSWQSFPFGREAGR